MDKINVFVYGNTNKEVLGTASCGISETKGKDASELEVFNDLKEFLISTDLKDKIEIEFVDICSIDIDENLKLKEILEKYNTPIISIEDKEFIVGNDHNVNVYMKIKKFI